MTRDDVMRETLKHKLRVADLMLSIIGELQERAVHHDDSKFSPEEYDYFAEATPKLQGLTYGSDEYRSALREIKPAIDHHNLVNAHHPEHFGEKGISGMSLVDLLEMICDWKAASERHADGNLERSIELNAKRFGYGDEIQILLWNTAKREGWI